MTPPKTRLSTHGYLVQHHYLVAFLHMLSRYECVKMHTVAYALFPSRTRSAAIAAAQRVVHNAARLKLIASVSWLSSERYYALTARGARYLNEVGPDDDIDVNARPTIKALALQNKKHRDWGVLIAIASEQRQMVGLSESLIAGALHKDISKYIGHVPDALTFVGSGCVWHEVETSRRSTTRRAAAPGAMSGIEKLKHLIDSLRAKHHVVYQKTEWPVTLMMHCGSAKIEREVRAVIEKAILGQPGEEKSDDGYTVNFERGGPMHIVINRLPRTIEEAWDGVLPWADCEVEGKSEVDRFVVRIEKAEE